MANTFALSQWFLRPDEANGPGDDCVRESILSDVYQFSVFGIFGGKVAVRTPNGRALIEARKVGGSPIVEFDYVPNGQARRIVFWMNADSVKDLGDRLRKARKTGREISFETILYGASPRQS